MLDKIMNKAMKNMQKVFTVKFENTGNIEQLNLTMLNMYLTDDTKDIEII